MDGQGNICGSVNLRKRAGEAVSEGLSRHQAAVRFKVSPATVIRWIAQLKTAGTVAAKPKGGNRKTGRVEAEAAFLIGVVETSPDTPLEEFQAHLEGRGLSVHQRHLGVLRPAGDHA